MKCLEDDLHYTRRFWNHSHIWLMNMTYLKEILTSFRWTSLEKHMKVVSVELLSLYSQGAQAQVVSYRRSYCAQGRKYKSLYGVYMRVCIRVYMIRFSYRKRGWLPGILEHSD